MSVLDYLAYLNQAFLHSCYQYASFHRGPSKSPYGTGNISEETRASLDGKRALYCELIALWTQHPRREISDALTEHVGRNPQCTK